MAYDEGAVRTVLLPHLVAAGFDLERLRITDAGPKTVIAVAVDNDAGPTLDDLAALSRTLSDAVDDADDVFGGQGFTLEVTTPGAERPLSEPRHWRRAQGRKAAVTLTDGSELVARIGPLSADDHCVTVILPKERTSPPTTREISLGEVATAAVQVEFRAPDPRELELSGLSPGRVAPGTPPHDLAESDDDGRNEE